MPAMNDVQSKLNRTEMAEILNPASPADVSSAVRAFPKRKIPLCPAGSLHSMGGQQFAEGGISMNSSGLAEIRELDSESGTVVAGAGATWPELVRWLRLNQKNASPELSIIQKQTGADGFTLGGSLSSNIHGRVLGRKPIIDDVESFWMTTADGRRICCSRDENFELFSLAIGGYGLFGFVDSVKLRLEPRVRLVRRVREISLDEVIPALEDHAREGATYGDFQYMTDESSPDFMAKGILSTYFPLGGNAGASGSKLGLSSDDWMRLYVLAHTDKARAYEEYARHYLKTDGQLYWSDEHQFSPYLPDAGDRLYKMAGWKRFASLMITELYVPRKKFSDFMRSARESILASGASVIYGTVRLIEAESESFLRWAKQDYACVIFNLLVEHSPEGIGKAEKQFQALIDCALRENGCYYLTYHRWARKDQAEKAYPEFPRFLKLKRKYDPELAFTSDWHRHYARMFSEN